MRLLAMALLLSLAGCSQTHEAGPLLAPAHRWVAVLVAGDDSLPVFDNATSQMALLLRGSGTPAADIHRLSAAPAELAAPHVQLANRAHVLDAIAALHPAAGQGCLVFITSHGAHGPGVYLAPHEEFVPPQELDAALQAGCGGAPTVAIVSACYTGGFASQPMARPNRIVLTAARADRPSFGCGAGRTLAYYDQCLLGSLSGLPRNWPDVIAGADHCVARMEAAEHVPASEPQSFVGRAVAGLPVIGG